MCEYNCGVCFCNAHDTIAKLVQETALYNEPVVFILLSSVDSLHNNNHCKMVLVNIMIQTD